MEPVFNPATEAERGILSSILTGKPEGMLWQDSLSVHFFQDVKHKHIYSAIFQLFVDGFPLDRLIVQHQLAKSGLLEMAGGEEYLRSLDHPVKTIELFESYADIIRTNSMKMALVGLGEKLVDLGKTETTDAEKDWEKARTELNKTECYFYQGALPGIGPSVDDFMRELEIRINKEKKEDGVATGLFSLDELINGFGKGELVIVGARPAMGKTGFMLSCVSNMLKRNIPVGWFTLEINTGMLLNRLVSMKSEVDSAKIRRGGMFEEELSRVKEASEEIKNMPLHIVDEAGIKVDRLALLARKLQQIHGVQLIVVDYLQLLSNERKNRYESRDLQLSEICRTLKRLARDLNIPVVVLSQLSRAVETRGGDKKPILSDLRESGSIEQDADKVLFLYRGEYYGLEQDCEGKSTKDIAEVIVAKNRFGPFGEAKVKFVSRFAKFENKEGDEREIYPDEIPIADETIREKFKRVFLYNDEKDIKPPF